MSLSLNVPWSETWYLKLFGSKFGRYKVSGWPLSRKWDISLYSHMFDKYESWVRPSMSLDAKHDIWIYLVIHSVNMKYWDDPCRENVILAYMVANLIKGKVEFFPWFIAWFVNLFGFEFGKMNVLKCPFSLKLDFGLYAYKFKK